MWIIFSFDTVNHLFLLKIHLKYLRTDAKIETVINVDLQFKELEELYWKSGGHRHIDATFVWFIVIRGL
jgi:hypothetical protein